MGAIAPTAPPVLEAQRLHKSFGAKHVLRGVDFQLGRAEVLAMLGPNGCGKSTLLRCLSLLSGYEEGRVFLQGRLVSSGRPEGHHPTREEKRQAQMLRRQVGMVFQRLNLFPHLTVLENVMCGPRYGLNKSEAEARAIAEEMLCKVGLREKLSWDPAKLSGGQQQRAAIARALAMCPQVMLFDEATSALDPLMTKEVCKVIRELAAEGMTMLLVTHDLDFAREIAGRVLFMEDGRITAQGPPGYIFAERPTPGLRKFLRGE